MQETSHEFKPYIASEETVKELSHRAIILGCMFGILFGAASVYLALRAGLTVSASIPVAVLAISLGRKFLKTTILENNIIQTTASAGESIASGVVFTLTGFLFLSLSEKGDSVGAPFFDYWTIFILAALGGCLGTLMMIPLRRSLIVKEHGNLPYPEGTACAEVLIAGEKGGATAKTVFGGFFAGLSYKMGNAGLKLWKEEVGHEFASFKGASVGAEVSPEMLGVGYIIGPRNGCIMIAGAILSSWVLIPMIKFFGSGWATPLFPGTKLIADMSIHEIWKNYVLYIGAGAVTTGGIIALVRSLPTIVRGAKAGIRSVKAVTMKSSQDSAEGAIRTEQDLPMSAVLMGCVFIIGVISIVPGFHMNIAGSILIVLFGFLFVTVSSRLTGEIGSSSNPISGMTVATLLFTSLIFLFLGWTSPEYRVTALSVAAIVCVAASNAGTTSQDLKTGYLLGATPKFQQWGLLIGAITSSLVIGYTLNVLNDASTIYSKNVPYAIVGDVANMTETSKVKDAAHSNDDTIYKVLRVREDLSQSTTTSSLSPGKYLVHPNSGIVTYLVDPGINGVLKTRDDGTNVQKFEAPKARLMSLIIDGILSQKLPWTLVLLGAAIAILMELCGISSLPFAVGVYLPMSTSAPIFFGGLVRGLVDYLNNKKAEVQSDSKPKDDDAGPGILFSSGLIAGGSIAGILLAVIAMSGTNWDLSAWFPSFSTGEWGASLMFALLMGVMFRVARSFNSGKI